jgi:tRNA(Ile)-lysidine synthase
LLRPILLDLFDMKNLVKTIQDFAFQKDLWEKGSKIVLGVSGGPDSVCLLDIFAKLAPKHGFQLHIAHVNYGLRGKDSKKDELFVRNLGEKYGIEASVLKSQKSLYKGNLEESLRQIRYDFFEKTRAKLDFDLIAVAHNRDDQAETVLMRVIRGSGLQGLAAMRAKNGNIIRPLLQISRMDILVYAKQNKLDYRVDKSNADTKFMRNKIRHKLIPYLEKNFNPSIKKTMAKWSIAVADDYAFINESAERFDKSICKNRCNHFSAKAFSFLSVSIQRQVLRNVLKKTNSSLLDAENGQIEEMIKVIRSTKSKNQKASIGGLNISKKGDKVILSRKA